MVPDAALPELGLHYIGTDRSMPVVDLARAAEARGLAALFLPEHTHIPVARTTPYPSGTGLPDAYRRLWDPYVALSFVAATTSLTVGTCVSLVAEHDAIALAKAVATLDRMSGGRFVLGVGLGWNREELDDHRGPGTDRRLVARETVTAMQRLWTEDEASFAGVHVRFAPSWAWPKPHQHPHPPVLFGCRPTAAGFAELARWADGWIPMTASPLRSLRDDLPRLHEAWCDAGRSGHPRVTVMQRVEPVATLRSLLDDYASLGVERVLVDVPTAPAGVVLPVLDALATLVP